MSRPGQGTVATITHLGRMGDGAVSAPDRETIYVRGALPGENVRLGSATRDRKILRAPLLEVLTASPVRSEVRCRVADRCGGCPLAHLARAGQLRVKEGWLREALRAQGLEVDRIEIETSSPEPGHAYRTRARLAWQSKRGRATVGYRVAQGLEVVRPDRCEVLAPALEAARAALTSALEPHLAGAGEIRIALSAPDPRSSADPAQLERVVASLESPEAQSPAFFQAIEGLVRDRVLAGARVRVGGTSIATSLGDPEERSRDLDGRLLVADAGAFRQAHLAATAELGARVLAWSRPEGQDVLELYAGHGHFSLSLAARARSLTTNELDPAAVRALAANAAAHSIPVEVRAEDAADTVARALRARPRPQVVVLDPPRVGAGPVITRVAELAPARVVYVSCDVATLARDAARLVAAGLPLRRVALVDLFPDTLHVELVALFER